MLNMFPSEAHYLTDEDTSLRIRQVTDAPCINHHPFFLIPAYDPAGRYLYFVSHRTGSPQLYAEDTAAHCILQLTDEPGLDEWSVHPCGDAVYFVAHGCAMRAFPHNGTVETLLTATEVHQRFHGVLGEGTTALTQDGHRWAIRIQQEHGFGILLWENGRWTQVYSGNMVAHLQFCPDDPDLLFFAGPLTDRVWVLDLAQGKAKRVFTRDAQRKQWITHESWIPGRRELSLVDWPHGIIAVNVDTSATRRVTTMNAWHAIANSQGTLMAADTNFPDTGIWLFDPRQTEAHPRLLCCPHASCMGAHWAEPFSYDNGPIKTCAPQHTHPHPRFSPDGRRLVFASDRSGFAQLYEVMLPDSL